MFKNINLGKNFEPQKSASDPLPDPKTEPLLLRMPPVDHSLTLQEKLEKDRQIVDDVKKMLNEDNGITTVLLVGMGSERSQFFGFNLHCLGPVVD